MSNGRIVFYMSRGFVSALTSGLLVLGVSCTSLAATGATADQYGGREMLVHVPSTSPPTGTRALVVVLHGGLGNAERIETSGAERGMNMDGVADQYGFVAAYLNGTPVTRLPGNRMLGWNAGGGCCGQSAARNVDDVGYIKGALDYLAGKYGIDRGRMFGVGHSNGAMMTARLVCETTLYAAAVTISGPLNLDVSSCPAARGRRVLAIHGADDQNVPVAGGRGTRGLARVAFASEDHARQVFTNSGASYVLDVVNGADHSLDHIDAAIRRRDGVSVAEKIARFFGLTAGRP
jgi:poly(3-hydroxybutyrate) depolymerase